jgi:hypothetical protein
MKIFTNTEFYGHYPVGSSALIVAKDVESAKKLLAGELEKIGLAGQKLDDSGFVEVDPSSPIAIILNDGDY